MSKVINRASILLIITFALLQIAVPVLHAAMPARLRRIYVFPTHPVPITYPTVPAQNDPRIARVLVEASHIAEHNAEPCHKLLCWRYVKMALLKAGAVAAYPSTINARDAGQELVARYGFIRLPINNPYQAPLGSVLVYSGYGPGHVELRSENGFVSDVFSTRACPWRLVGVFAKFTS